MVDDEPYILGWDGGVVTGWAKVSREGDPIKLGHLNLGEIVEWLENTTHLPKVIVYEDFLLFKGKALAQTGSRFETVTSNGYLTSWAQRNKIPTVRQSTAQRDAGYSWGQIPDYRKSNHSLSHKFDAYAHVYHYMVNSGMIKTVLELDGSNGATQQSNRRAKKAH